MSQLVYHLHPTTCTEQVGLTDADMQKVADMVDTIDTLFWPDKFCCNVKTHIWVGLNYCSSRKDVFQSWGFSSHIHIYYLEYIVLCCYRIEKSYWYYSENCKKQVWISHMWSSCEVSVGQMSTREHVGTMSSSRKLFLVMFESFAMIWSIKN